MPTYVALLRAVNLGGSTQVGMAELRELLVARGFGSVRTVLQSGNAIFSAPARRERGLEVELEDAIEARFGRRTDVMVRTTDELRAIRDRNPFPAEAKADPSHLIVVALKEAPSPEGWKALRAAIVGRERAEGNGREAYIVYPDGIGGSTLTANRIEKALGIRGTARNWNTIGKLAIADND